MREWGGDTNHWIQGQLKDHTGDLEFSSARDFWNQRTGFAYKHVPRRGEGSWSVSEKRPPLKPQGLPAVLQHRWQRRWLLAMKSWGKALEGVCGGTKSCSRPEGTHCLLWITHHTWLTLACSRAQRGDDKCRGESLNSQKSLEWYSYEKSGFCCHLGFCEGLSVVDLREEEVDDTLVVAFWVWNAERKIHFGESGNDRLSGLESRSLIE